MSIVISLLLRPQSTASSFPFSFRNTGQKQSSFSNKLHTNTSIILCDKQLRPLLLHNKWTMQRISTLFIGTTSHAYHPANVSQSAVFIPNRLVIFLNKLPIRSISQSANVCCVHHKTQARHAKFPTNNHLSCVASQVRICTSQRGYLPDKLQKRSCTLSWEKAHVPLALSSLRSPLCVSLHNVCSGLQLKQMVTLDGGFCVAIIAFTWNSGKRLKHTVTATLLPVIQGHACKLVLLQYRNWSTLRKKNKTYSEIWIAFEYTVQVFLQLGIWLGTRLLITIRHSLFWSRDSMLG